MKIFFIKITELFCKSCTKIIIFRAIWKFSDAEYTVSGLFFTYFFGIYA